MPDDWWEGKGTGDGSVPPLTMATLSNHIHNLRTEGNAALKKEFQTIKSGANPCRSVLGQYPKTCQYDFCPPLRHNATEGCFI
jgi:hypothetical protein